MHISANTYPAAYRNIVARSRGSTSSTTFILVSPDVDAICAARILQDLLKSDGILNTVMPVGSWPELRKVIDVLLLEDVRSLILLNFGANRDIAQIQLGLDEDGNQLDFSQYFPNTLVHIIDSHRPISLGNLFAEAPYASAILKDGMKEHEAPRVSAMETIVWRDTEGSSEDAVRSMRVLEEAFQDLVFEPPEADSDEDDSSSDEELGIGRRYQSDDSDEDDERDGSPGSQKRRRTSAKPLSKRQEKERLKKARAVIANYYRAGTFVGQSVATQVFLLAVECERGDEDSVWLAILGLTYQFSTNQIDFDRYEDYTALLADEVARLSSIPESLRVSSDPSASSGPNDRSIRPSKELRFCLVRHWNLYDAMYHSTYVAGRMKLWKEKGRKNLSGMLARMGYSLAQCQQTYAHMDLDLKNNLFHKVDELKSEYGLHDLTYASFIRKSGYRSDISSSDAVEALGALLEVATGVRLDFGNGGVGTGAAGGGREEWSEGIKNWVQKDGRGGDKENVRPALREDGEEHDDEDEAAALALQKKELDWATRNFWLAWDALSTDTTLLRAALPLSMALHRAVIRQGTFMLDKQSVKSNTDFRYALFDEGPDLAVFRHPSTLLRLANWLVDTVRDFIGEKVIRLKEMKRLPFVLACLNEAKDSFLVVGIVGAIDFGNVRKNHFALVFQEAAEALAAPIEYAAFDASVVRVRREDLAKFIQRLAVGRR